MCLLPRGWPGASERLRASLQPPFWVHGIITTFSSLLLAAVMSQRMGAQGLPCGTQGARRDSAGNGLAAGLRHTCLPKHQTAPDPRLGCRCAPGTPKGDGGEAALPLLSQRVNPGPGALLPTHFQTQSFKINSTHVRFQGGWDLRTSFPFDKRKQNPHNTSFHLESVFCNF